MTDTIPILWNHDSTAAPIGKIKKEALERLDVNEWEALEVGVGFRLIKDLHHKRRLSFADRFKKSPSDSFSQWLCQAVRGWKWERIILEAEPLEMSLFPGKKS